MPFATNPYMAVTEHLARWGAARLSRRFAWVFFRICERPFMTSFAVKRSAKPKPAPVVEDEIALAREVA